HGLLSCLGRGTAISRLAEPRQPCSHSRRLRAVAALMGAFLVRFPKTKIEVALVLGLRSLTNLALGKGIRFKAAAYWLLPLWLLLEIISGELFCSYYILVLCAPAL